LTATVHRFQGDERDALVMDLVDTWPFASPSTLTATDPELSLRLLNVGMSRARGKFVLVADLSFLAEYYPRRSHARAIVERSRAIGAEVIDANDVLHDVPGLVTWHADWAEAFPVGFASVPDTRPTHWWLPDDEFDGEWLGESIAEQTRSAKHDGSFPVVVHAPIEVARRYEDTSADLRLQTIGAGAYAFGHDAWVLVGGAYPTEPACRISSPDAVRTMRTLMTTQR
jgi:hypothetical protein